MQDSDVRLRLCCSVEGPAVALPVGDAAAALGAGPRAPR